MEALSKIQGTELPDISTPTYAHFIPQLLLNPLIKNATPQTHRYGALPSQELDVYLPPTRNELNVPKPPVFIFYYGGGYISGRKRMSLRDQVGSVFTPDLTSLLESNDHKEILPVSSRVDHLYHQNIGTFIATHGFVIVIPDYRLVNTSPEWQGPRDDEAVFPSGAEDVLLSMQWAVENLSAIADTSRIAQLLTRGCASTAAT